MFKKPIKIKTNTQTKGSERKNFKDLLLKSFANLTEDQVNELLPKKEVLNTLKVVTHDETVLQVYTIQKRPVIFDVNGKMFPTIFLLWKFPDLVQAFTTHQQVMNFLTSGADLMLPGVVTPPSHTGLPKYGNVSENEIVCVNLTHTKAAVAVGVATQSSSMMALANSRGKCVNIYHFHGDHLCSLEGMPNSPLPNLGSPDWLKMRSFDEDFPELGSTRKHESNVPDPKDTALSGVTEAKEEPSQALETVTDNFKETPGVEDVDGMLCYCFIGALKYSKNLTLPVLTSNFFKLHMLPMCLPDKNLDIKKSSFKKLKPFLEKMSEEGFITIKEVKTGVETITEINRDHPKYTAFYICPNDRPKKDENEKENVQTTDIVESYVVTQNVLTLFTSAGYKKGDTIQGPEVRKCITKFVKENNLQDNVNSRLVKPAGVLATICKTENPVTWEEVMEKICLSMKNCFKVKSGDAEIVNTGKVSPITISVSVRSGNKKVTLVDNLELFGIRLNEFSKKCQHGVAASTSITKPPGKKYDQLLVQGNQVLFIYNLLTNEYKVPKKYIRGLENAPKKKK